MFLHSQWAQLHTGGVIRHGAAEAECIMLAEEMMLVADSLWPLPRAAWDTLTMVRSMLLVPKGSSTPLSLGLRAQRWMQWHYPMACVATMLCHVNLLYRHIHANQERRRLRLMDPTQRPLADPRGETRALLRISDPPHYQPKARPRAVVRSAVRWQPAFVAPQRMILRAEVV